VLAVSFAHFAHDVFTSLLPPFLPLIIGSLGISLFQAGSLVVATQLPSLLNPWVGYLTDRWRIQRWLLVIAPGTTGVIICLIGLAPGYGVLVTLLLTAGFSVAALHVSGPVMIRQFAGPLVGRGMGFFMFAGEMARTLSPLIAVQLVSLFGLHGIWRLAPVAAASSVVLWWRLPRDVEDPDARPPLSLLSTWRRARRLIIAVGGVLVARAFLVAALTTFLPTFIYGEGGSLWVANISLSVVELAGAAGALTMGSVSDRLGRRRVLVGCVVLAPLAMLAFMVAGGVFRFVTLLILGFVAISTTPVLIAVMIEHAGANPGTQNGTFMMMNFAIRGLIILVVGAMGDILGLRESFVVCAVLAMFGLPFALLVPSQRPGGTS
jgi:FSR family fosmidomycin resistance protein-like MFS transporter